jgi:formamidopyrimidine-DNA glycosylase
MHFGMTGECSLCLWYRVSHIRIGWLHIKEKQTSYTNLYNRTKAEERDMWPPKFWKFHLLTDDPDIEIAFTDPRRFGRVRLIDCAGSEIRTLPPLSDNGPDPVVDPQVFTYEYLLEKTRSRHVPIKALLLDQAMISGIGNWVGDEVLYQARLHPEQYCDEFSEKEIKKLYEAVRHVCQTAVDKLADSDEFPSDWLFRYRWGKGAANSTKALPNGEKLAFMTVGGRTSCFAPRLQKKTGHVAAGAKEVPIGATDKPTEVQSKRKAKQTTSGEPSNNAEEAKQPPRKRNKRSEAYQTSNEQPLKSPQGKASSISGSATGGRRRSGRLSAKAA